MTKVVPIIFACDNAYAMPFGVTLASLLDNKPKGVVYAVHCLVPAPLSTANLAKLESLVAQHDNVTLDFTLMGDAFADVRMSIPHISFVTYYRLKIPSLFPQYKRCLYLDVDLIVRADVTPLLNMDLTLPDGRDALLAGVPHAAYRHRGKVGDFKIVRGEYVNAGVLVMNLEAMRTEKLEPVFLGMMKHGFRSQDQDILNVVCSGRIKKMDLAYNYMPKLGLPGELGSSRVFYRMHGMDFDAARQNPQIIHYADKYKPWRFYCLPYGNFWHEVFQATSFADVSLQRKNYLPFAAMWIVRLQILKLIGPLLWRLRGMRKRTRKMAGSLLKMVKRGKGAV